MSSLVLVESPAKIKKVRAILDQLYGKGSYDVGATMGHIRDLPPKELGIDVHNGFKPTYIPIPDKKKLISQLRKKVKAADALVLAMDPDREGEAIAWHTVALLKPKCKVIRVTFNAITPTAIQAGFEQARKIDMPLVQAQETRRILDRLVGYTVSPMLWRAIDVKGLSAGRVQSVALRLVVERQRSINNFVPREYYALWARFKTANGEFDAKLWLWQGKKWDSNMFPTLQSVEAIISQLKGAKGTLSTLDQVIKPRRPTAPFTTSTLQQAASKHLKLSPETTMQFAQKLYEAGHITYMRTDSVAVSPEGQQAAATEIKQRLGDSYLPDKPRRFKGKSGAQEAHECIRPTHVETSQIDAEDNPQLKQLYHLIWRRFLASQMADARYTETIAEVTVGQGVFRTSGIKLSSTPLRFEM